MRRSLRWALGVTGLASVAAIWWNPAPGGSAGSGPPAADEAADRYAPWRSAAASSAPTSLLPSPLPSNLPSQLPERDTEAGGRDLFVAISPPAPPPAPPPPPPAPPPPPPPPAPPPMTWRALGAMIGPDGRRAVWLARGGAELAVTPGMALDDGYVVRSVEADAVVLGYPPLGTTERLPLPQAPSGVR